MKKLIVLAITILFLSIQTANSSPHKFYLDDDQNIEWQGIVVHHSATENGNAASINNYHINERKWRAIGYHFVIIKDGTIENGRSLKTIGAHAKGRNQTHIGICLIGKDEFTDAQIRSTVTLLNTLVEMFPTIKSIERHHEECPGKGIPVEQLNTDIIEFWKHRTPYSFSDRGKNADFSAI